MAAFLHKLGVYSFTHKWRIISTWLVLLVVLGVLAITFITPTSSSISIPGTEAQKALDRANQLFPGLGSGTGRVVLEAKDGQTIGQLEPEIRRLSDNLAEVAGVERVVSPLENPGAVSENNQIAYIQLQLEQSQGSIQPATIEAITNHVDQARSDTLRVEMGGDIINQAPSQILGIGEVGGVVVALFVLVLALGSLVAAGLPIIIALVTVGVSMAGLFSLSQLIEINATTPVLAVMLGLAVGIDYSLFIISKYRRLVIEGMEPKQAAGRAVGTAGNAVIFAALTVVIALAALAIVQIPFMTTMGLAGAATIALAALVAVSMVPALLGVAGDRLFSKKARSRVAHLEHDASTDESNIWFRWGKLITRHPIKALLGSLVIIAGLAWPIQHLELGLPSDQYAGVETTQRQAYDLLSEGFGEGFNGPLLVVAEQLPAVSEAEYNKVQSQLIEQAPMQPNGPVSPEATAQMRMQVEQYAKLYQLSLVANEIAALPGVQQAQAVQSTDDGTKGLIQVIPAQAPSEQATIDLIENLRRPETQSQVSPEGSISLAVTGATALQTDINQKLTQALPVYISVVIGLSLILLVIAFRSILVPIKATLGFLLSVLVMFGSLVAVFQWGWFGIAEAPGPIVSFIPIIAVGVLFGLAMDYEFFLVSGMHEAYGHSKDAKRAVVLGFGQGAKVVTAACVIMVAVFAGFITNHDATIQAIGFGLAVGILVDALLVRMTVVPAVMTLLGSRAWWLPNWLDKRLPHVSIEGEDQSKDTEQTSSHGTNV